MKTLMKLFTAALAAAAMGLLSGGCTDNLAEADGIEEGCINISLGSRELSRATEADVDALNENLVTSALVCLYPQDNPGDTPAVVKYFSNLDIHTSGVVKITLTADLRNQLFPDGTGQCSAYVIANIPAVEAGSVSTDTKLSDLRMRAIQADFASKEPQPSFAMDGTSTQIGLQPDGRTAIGQVDMQRVASKINLAVKVAESVTDEAGQTWTPASTGIVALISNGVNRSTYTPSAYTPVVPNDYFSTYYAGAEDPAGQRELTKVDGEEYPYQLSQPFYTFPNRWDEADLNRTNMTYMTLRVPWQRSGESEFHYCYYTVPVVKGAEIGRNISYRVKLNVNMLGSFTPDEPMELTDLSYYAVEWGSVSDNVDLLESRYLVVDQNEFTLENLDSISIPVYSSHEIYIKDITLTFYRYYYHANGKEQPITITRTQWQNTIDKGFGYIYKDEAHNPDAADSHYWVKFEHELVEWTPYKNNTDYKLTYNPDTNYDPSKRENLNEITHYRKTDPVEKSYTRYVAKITISHADLKDEPEKEKNYEQVITITQYPDIFIESTGNVFKGSGVSVTPTEGNMYVNNNQDKTDKDGHNYLPLSPAWYTALGLGAATNACPNQYVISVTQLSLGSNYIIGDPRTQTPLDLDNFTFPVDEYTTGKGIFERTYTYYFNGKDYNNKALPAPKYYWSSAPDIDTGRKRVLRNYYPTDKSAGKERWIAPKFRVASSYAVCYLGSYEAQQARCASYQEMRYPAGRWRIPTVAEIEYIMTLSQENKIPMLFNTGTTYMSAQGVINTDDITSGLKPDNTQDGAAVRCVYDEWYWGNDTIQADENGKYPFTWGDRAR